MSTTTHNRVRESQRRTGFVGFEHYPTARNGVPDESKSRLRQTTTPALPNSSFGPESGDPQ